jgi:probable rRNA maturation factor
MSTNTVDLQIASRSKPIPSKKEFSHWIALATEGLRTKTEVSIRIVDRAESQSLNQQYREKDSPTNVLSFPAEFPEGVDIAFIGDLVICAPVVSEEAEAQAKSLTAHWAHMVIHGTLHLLGYDHIEDADAEEMETIETRLLATLGYPCPYTETDSTATDSNAITRS